MKLYSGNNTCVSKPSILIHGEYRDFGYGFYCTVMEKQAQRWALTKSNGHIVNIYDYDEQTTSADLKVLSFPEMTDPWLDFVVDCRDGISHNFDIVEGPMADDTVWNYVEDYRQKKISRAAFWELAKFKYPTHQISFCNEKSISCINFERSYTL